MDMEDLPRPKITCYFVYQVSGYMLYLYLSLQVYGHVL